MTLRIIAPPCGLEPIAVFCAQPRCTNWADEPYEAAVRVLLQGSSELVRSATSGATHGCRLLIDRQCVLMDLNNLLT